MAAGLIRPCTLVPQPGVRPPIAAAVIPRVASGLRVITLLGVRRTQRAITLLIAVERSFDGGGSHFYASSKRVCRDPTTRFSGCQAVLRSVPRRRGHPRSGA